MHYNYYFIYLLIFFLSHIFKVFINSYMKEIYMIMSYHLYILIYPEKNLNPIKESQSP